MHNFIEPVRVFDDKYPNSEKWNFSFGGGFWVSFVDDAISGSLTIGSSPEYISYYFNLKLVFLD